MWDSACSTSRPAGSYACAWESRLPCVRSTSRQVAALKMDQFAVIKHHAVHVARAVGQYGHAVPVRADRGDALVQRVELVPPDRHQRLLQAPVVLVRAHHIARGVVEPLQAAVRVLGQNHAAVAIVGEGLGLAAPDLALSIQPAGLAANQATRGIERVRGLQLPGIDAPCQPARSRVMVVARRLAVEADFSQAGAPPGQ